MFSFRRSLLLVAFGALSAVASAQYTFVNLDPGGFNGTQASAAVSGQQVGCGDNGVSRGLLWTGTAASAVDMTPTSVASASAVLGTDGTQQVGYIVRNGDPNNVPRAWLWNGTPESGSTLNPNVPFTWNGSEALANDNGQQVGWGNQPGVGRVALVWSGTRASFVILQPDGWLNSEAVAVHNGVQGGYMVDLSERVHAAIWHGDSSSFEDYDATPAAAGYGGSQITCLNDTWRGGVIDATDHVHAAVWDTSMNFRDLNGSFALSAVAAISGNTLVGTGDNGDGISHAMLWDAVSGSGTDLNQYLPAGYIAAEATGVDSDGNVVGIAYDGTSKHACMWKPFANHAPVANAGPDKTFTIPHDGDPNTNRMTITLDGSASSDPDAGQTLTYEWRNQNNVVVGTDAVLVRDNVPVGPRDFTLKVTDPFGASSTDTVHVDVLPEPNAAPIANAGPDQTLTTNVNATTVQIVLDASATTDPDGDTIFYSWVDQDGNVLTDCGTMGTVVRGPGDYTFTVTASDPYGASSSSSVHVHVLQGNRSPVAIVGPDITAQVPHDGNPATNTATVTLDGSASSDPDGDHLIFDWRDSNDMLLSNAPTFSLALPPGTYTFKLQVFDPSNLRDTAYVHVTVLAESNNAPVANAGTDATVTASSNGTASISITASGVDPNGDPLTVVWSENGTQIGSDFTLNTTLAAGVHTLTETVTDPYGASSSDSVTVNVWYSASPPLQPINADNSSIFKAGSTVAVKFQMTGISSGAVISAHLYIAKVTNDIIGTEMEAVSTSAADSGNTFRYSGGQYIFNLSTKNLTTGTYQLRFDLGDGNPYHAVLISLK